MNDMLTQQNTQTSFPGQGRPMIAATPQQAQHMMGTTMQSGQTGMTLPGTQQSMQPGQTGMTMPAIQQSMQTGMITIPDEMVPETLSNPLFTPGFLQTQIGKNMRVEFLIGDQTTDRVGRLIQVGASYILLQAYDQYTIYMCDMYSIKFVSIVNSQDANLLLTLE